MSDENKAIIRRLYLEALNLGNLDVIDEIYAPDVELRLPGTPQDPFGPAPIRQLFALLQSTFPGIRASIEDLVAEGDEVVARVTLQRAHDGRMVGVAPQSREVSWPRIEVFRLFQGQIIEQWADRDDVGLLQQLGIMPPALDSKGRVPARDYSR